MEFDRLANRHRDAVYAQMVRLCGNHEDAEDTMVEALLSAYRAAPTLKDEGAFRGWLAQIARRVCFRLRHRPEIAILHDVPSPTLGPEEAAVTQYTRDCIHQAILSLPLSYREVYRLRDLEGRTAVDTAEQLDLTVPNVKSRLRRARILVRKAVEENFCLG